ncbi:MAG: preprotein translocase subunit SecG [Candidatus Falkowbacteria bacterium]
MDIITIVQIITAIALITVILLQNKGGGMSGVFGGSGGGGGSNVFSTKRGLEKILFRATIILAIIFIVLSLLNVIA